VKIKWIKPDTRNQTSGQKWTKSKREKQDDRTSEQIGVIFFCPGEK
jgi:hypothetical protein